MRALARLGRRRHIGGMIDQPRPDFSLYEAGRKSLVLAYILWFFLGLVGAHRFMPAPGAAVGGCWRCNWVAGY